MKDSVKNKIKSAEFTAPLLVIFVILAMRLSVRALNNPEMQENIFLAIGVVQLVAFGLPCIAYYLLKGKKLSEPIYGIPKRGPQLLFMLFAALFFVGGTLLIKFFYFALGASDAAIVNFYGDITESVANATHGEIILSLIVIPAICEEMLFRGIIFSEYRCYGTANAIIISALSFAMLHFSVRNFLIYLFAGLVFGFVTAMTRSVVPSMLLHLLSNTLNIYASDSFLRITVDKNGSYFVGFVLVVFVALAFILLLSRVETICHGYADRPPMEVIPPKSSANIGKVFFSPTFALLIIVFILVTIL